MSITKIIALVVVALIFGNGVYWYLNNQTSVSSTPQAEESDSVQTSDLAALFKKGGGYECTISMKTDQASSNGTVYVSGSDVRGDFTSLTGVQTVTSSMIQTGGYVYTWSNMIPQGFKFKSTVDANPIATLGAGQMPEGGSYTCKKWTVDASVFVPPKNVPFSEAPTGIR
jgi:hypothetical protein